MKDKILKTAKFLFFLGIGIGLIWLVVKDLTEKDKADIYKSFGEANYWWIIVTILLGFVSNVSRAIRWQMLMKPLGHSPRLDNTVYAIFIGYMANYALPRLGEVTRCGILNRYDKVPMNELLGTVLAERAIDILCLILIFFYTLFAQHSLIYNYTEQKLLLPLWNKLAPLFANKTIVIVFFVLFLLAAWLLIRFVQRANTGIVSKLSNALKGFINGMVSIKNIDKPFLFVFHSVFIWVMYFLMNYVGFWAFAETTNLSLNAGFSTLVFGSVGMIVVQGGIGAYPLIIMETLKLYGVSPAVGFAYGWIAWSAQAVEMILLGFLSLLLLPLVNRTNSISK